MSKPLARYCLPQPEYPSGVFWTVTTAIGRCAQDSRTTKMSLFPTHSSRLTPCFRIAQITSFCPP